MKSFGKFKLFLNTFLFLTFGIKASLADTPKLTVVIIIDQFAAHYKILRPYFKDGLSVLFKKGVVYENAKCPHAMPATAPGHTTLSTGTLPRYHGIVGNYWFDKTGSKKIKCDEDSAQDASVFSPKGFYNYGKSAKNLIVDGLSDQVLIAEANKFKVYSVSLKSRAAIGMGNRSGKAIWFDTHAGRFTTSKAFFDTFPTWVSNFNKNLDIKPITYLEWDLSYPLNSAPYNFKNILSDTYTNFTIKVENNKLIAKPRFNVKSKIDSHGKYSGFTLMPDANEAVLNLALECVKTQLYKDGTQNMLLWVSLSSLDKIGHEFGPQSILAIDMIYKLDSQIGNFMNEVSKLVNKDEILYVLSADHGCMQIPELLAQQKINAHRVGIQPYVDKINKKIEAKFGKASFLKAFKAPQVFIDEVAFKKLPKEKIKEMDDFIKKEIRKIPYVKSVYTPYDLTRLHFSKSSFEHLFKNQYFSGRSGHFNILVYPYCLIDDHGLGTDHKTPYNYDTNVPLVFYRENHLENKSVFENVTTFQVAPTLAGILKVQKPSCAIGNVLPGIFDKK